ncbi:MAG TPA: hypothetical protein VHP14_22835 [Anaerolineales bacterium]|nr:hypothetical protein [Anaerolineales bacterium]
MYYFPNPNFEERTRWRNASEVQAAAIEHEKRRFETYGEGALAKPQLITKNRRRSKWATVFTAVLLFLINK